MSEGNNLLAKADEVLPNVIHLLPIAARPFFPGQGVPLLMDSQYWRSTIHAINESDNRLIGLLLTRDARAEETHPDAMYRVGTVGRIHKVHEEEGKLQVLVECLQRFEVESFISEQPPYVAQVKYLREPAGKISDEIKTYSLAIINTIKELLPLNPLLQEELRFFLDRFGPENPSMLADFATGLVNAPKDQQQEILETIELLPRMEKVLILLSRELELAKAQQKIRESVEERMDEQQREFFLREQLKVIQQELGLSKDDRTSDVEKFRERLQSLTLSKEAQQTVEEELDKLSVLEPSSSEYNVTRNYLDWITLLPWGIESADNLNLKHARDTLNKDHYGLDDVKERILEFLAVGIQRGEIKGSIILLVGPPGVGKTSIGKSVAEAMNRKFYRFSVGGIRDEAEIKGHRRTYIGAMPGKFIQAMKQVGTQNPVIMLDEIDKIGSSYQGDPASALLEVLDPEQNSDFLDHYLDLRFDLSETLFICTANQLDTIPGPLLDRMEIIQLSGYIAEEKLQIARRYLLPRQIREAGLKRREIKLNSPALRQLIEDYARDAGVRRLDKQLARIVRKSVVRFQEGESTPIEITKKNLRDFLGPVLFKDERHLIGPGIITGLAWTAMGGATLSIEAVHTHSYNRGFKLTGQLGDVMKESAEIAYGYVVSHAAKFGIDQSFFEKAFIHLHVPAGATPKDGPSAGVTIASALVSLALGKPAKKLAMTGELTLTGEVFPVGGIREKVIAARRSGIRELILPVDNQGDWEEIPDYIKKGIRVHFATTYDDVWAHLFRQ